MGRLKNNFIKFFVIEWVRDSFGLGVDISVEWFLVDGFRGVG